MADLPAAPRGQTTALTTLRNPDTFRALMKVNAPKFADVLPKGVTLGEVTSRTIICCSRNPALWDCDPGSMLLAVAEALSLGLKLDAISGEAYPVPFAKKVTMIPGYRGLQNIAYATGLVKAIEARAVYSADTFDWVEGTDPKLVHKPTLADEPGAIVATYARAVLTDGTTIFKVVPRRDIEATRNRSKAKDSGPWKTDYESMACKTAVRRLFKALPTHPLTRDSETAGLREEGLYDGPLNEKTANIEFTTTLDTTGQEVPPEQTATGKLKGKLKGAKGAGFPDEINAPGESDPQGTKHKAGASEPAGDGPSGTGTKPPAESGAQSWTPAQPPEAPAVPDVVKNLQGDANAYKAALSKIADEHGTARWDGLCGLHFGWADDGPKRPESCDDESTLRQFITDAIKAAAPKK